jgi:hypothetical protein
MASSKVQIFGGGLRHGQRDRDDGIAAHVRLVGRAVHFDQPRVDVGLVERVHAENGARERPAHVGHGGGDVIAA